MSSTRAMKRLLWVLALSSSHSLLDVPISDPPLPRGCNMQSGKRCRLQDGTLHPEFLRTKARYEQATPSELELWKENEKAKRREEKLERLNQKRKTSDVYANSVLNGSDSAHQDSAMSTMITETDVRTHFEQSDSESTELYELMKQAGLSDGYPYLRNRSNGTTAAVIANLGRGWLLSSTSEELGLPNAKVMNLWRRVIGKIKGESYRDLAEGSMRGAREARVLAASAVVDAGGPFAWERGSWSGPAFNACPLLKDLLPGASSVGSNDPEPPMASVLKSCPIDACLRYGQIKSSPSPQQYILNDDAVDDLSALFLNASSTRLKGTKSQCYRMTGPREVILSAVPLRKGAITDEKSMLCNKVHHAACCQGEWRPPGTSAVGGRVYCTGCLPYFIALGPEKTGTTDLYNRIGLMHGVVPSAVKETGFWSENAIPSQHKESLMSYSLKYFKELSGHISGERKIDVPLNISRKKYFRGRKYQSAAPNCSSSGRDSESCDAITGEATPAYLGWEHHGLAMVPRWLACVHPTVKLIVTLRDPVQRTYSDYHFFGRLQALRQPALVREVTGGLVGKEGAEAFVQQLSPKAFDARVHEEIAELQRCFVDLPDGRLIWKPPPVKKRLRWDCETIRTDQLGRHAVNSKRLPGRLLISLYPLHLARWLRYFACSQVLLLRSTGEWSADALQRTARFLGVDEVSAMQSATASAVRPEQHWFNREAAGLGSKAPKEPMLGRTRRALQTFFEVYWDARFPEESNQPEPCTSSRH